MLLRFSKDRVKAFTIVSGMFLVVGCGLFSASSASADVLFSFGFTDLDGDWDANTSVFSANANNDTGGDVTRLKDPAGSAEYASGFYGSNGTLGDYNMSMVLSNISSQGAEVQDGDGSFLITDNDGDTISGSIVGQWLPGNFGFLFFNGHLSDVVYSEVNGTFDGPSGGSFSTDYLPADPPYEGAIITLSISGNGGFFDKGSFSDSPTLVSAEVVPTPGAGLVFIAGFGGISCLARRRRRG